MNNSTIFVKYVNEDHGTFEYVRYGVHDLKGLIRAGIINWEEIENAMTDRVALSWAVDVADVQNLSNIELVEYYMSITNKKIIIDKTK